MIKDSVDAKTYWHIGNLPYLPYCRVRDLVNLHHVCECVVTSNGIMEVSQQPSGVMVTHTSPCVAFGKEKPFQRVLVQK